MKRNAIHLAIDQLEELGVHHQTIKNGDSQVVIKNNGEWALQIRFYQNE